MRFVTVAELSDVAPGENRAFVVEGSQILICRTDDRIFAVENRCSHNGSALEGGRMRGCYLVCPVHGARFDLRDGSTAGALTKVPLKTYRVSVENGKIVIGLGLEGQDP